MQHTIADELQVENHLVGANYSTFCLVQCNQSYPLHLMRCIEWVLEILLGKICFLDLDFCCFSSWKVTPERIERFDEDKLFSKHISKVKDFLNKNHLKLLLDHPCMCWLSCWASFFQVMVFSRFSLFSSAFQWKYTR